VNVAISGGAMYPPISRDKQRTSLNKVAVERIAHLLEQRGAVVGMHPAGTRGKGADPYELLPAKPGVGQRALRSNATVLPIWLSGMGNEISKQVLANCRGQTTRNAPPVRVSFGPPVDLSALQHEDVSERDVQLKAANRIMDAVRLLGSEEQQRLTA